MSQERRRIHLFLDSNVLTGGLVARWGLDRAVLSMCASRVCQLVLAEAVREEVETNLLRHVAELPEGQQRQILDDYHGLIELTSPQIIHYPSEANVLASRRLIAHASDVPVLLSAIESKPDWLLTHNLKHFTREVADRTGLRIATPIEFFRTIAEGVRAAGTFSQAPAVR